MGRPTPKTYCNPDGTSPTHFFNCWENGNRKEEDKFFIEKYGRELQMYAMGQFYAMSMDVAKTVRDTAKNEHKQIAIERKFREDHDVFLLAFRHLRPLHFIMIDSRNMFWQHPVKPGHIRFGQKWSDELRRIRTLMSQQQLAATIPVGYQGNADSANETNEPLSFNAFEEINLKLLSHEYPKLGCPKHCGCVETGVDCLRQYSLDVVQASASAALSTSANVQYHERLESHHRSAKSSCLENSSTDSGGYCLSKSVTHNPMVKSQQRKDPMMLNLPTGEIITTFDYGASPQRIVEETASLLIDDNATSVVEFGAGVGQLSVAVLPLLAKSTFFKDYHRFDGAGNVEEISKGFVKYADLTLPLDVPKADWVVSLEVAEHIPAHYEGMVVRNLHRHNCKGILLSWGVLRQAGFNHINNHSNEAVVEIFKNLGYEHDTERQKRFRQASGNRQWFMKSVMVFRRKDPVC